MRKRFEASHQIIQKLLECEYWHISVDFQFYQLNFVEAPLELKKLKSIGNRQK
jgi:hypothetical protein